MQQMETSLGVSSFFMMDENFLLNRPRAMQLLARMKEAGKSWALYVFSSVNAIRKYTMEELVQLGVSWIWVGLESPNSTYAKLKNSDTRALAAELRQHGIKLLGSTIVGLEHHTPENIHAGDRIRGLARHRLPPVHAVHAGAGHAAVRPDAARRPHARRRRPGRHSRAVQVQLQARRHLARRVEDDFSIGPSGVTSSAMVPACFASAKPSSRDGNAITTIPTCECGVASLKKPLKLRTTYNAALWAMEKRLRTTNPSMSKRIRDAAAAKLNPLWHGHPSGSHRGRSGLAVDLEARRQPPGQRRDLRAGDVRRATQLGREGKRLHATDVVSCTRGIVSSR